LKVTRREDGSLEALMARMSGRFVASSFDFAAEHGAEKFPGFALESSKLHLLDRREIDRAGVDGVPGNGLVGPEFLQVCRLLHHVLACEIVTALLQHLNKYLGHIEACYQQAISPVAFAEILGEELVERLRTRIVVPSRTERVHQKGDRNDILRVFNTSRLDHGSNGSTDAVASCAAASRSGWSPAACAVTMRARRSMDASATLVGTDGRGLVIEPHPASIQDRDGGGPLLRASRRIFPFIQRVFADSGYAGEKVAKATLIAVEIVRKNRGQVGFAVNPRRWVVERFFAWIGRNRRLAKDFEANIGSARAFLYAASVMLFVRRIAHAS
jgi:transposase